MLVKYGYVSTFPKHYSSFYEFCFSTTISYTFFLENLWFYTSSNSGNILKFNNLIQNIRYEEANRLILFLIRAKRCQLIFECFINNFNLKKILSTMYYIIFHCSLLVRKKCKSMYVCGVVEGKKRRKETKYVTTYSLRS